MSDTCECRPSNLGEKSAGYRRALALVVALNLGMGIIEMASAVLAGSQRAKSRLARLSGRWCNHGTRAAGDRMVGGRTNPERRSSREYSSPRLVSACSARPPTASWSLKSQKPVPWVSWEALHSWCMSRAQRCCAPHRGGDANARAVWLFSRNDAIGNAAVIVAAAAVALTGTPWPDLVVAVAIAGVFLHSSRDIIRDSLAERRELTRAVATS